MAYSEYSGDWQIVTRRDGRRFAVYEVVQNPFGGGHYQRCSPFVRSHEAAEEMRESMRARRRR